MSKEIIRESDSVKHSIIFLREDLGELEYFYRLSEQLFIEKQNEIIKNGLLSDNDKEIVPRMTRLIREHKHRENHIYPNYLRSAFLTQIISTFEYHLDGITTKIGNELNQRFKVADLAGSSIIAKGQRYIKEMVDINIGAYPEWNYIKDCQELRNKVMHSLNIINENTTAYKFAVRNNSLSVKPYIEYATHKTFKVEILDNKMNYELIKNINALITRLISEIYTT